MAKSEFVRTNICQSVSCLLKAFSDFGHLQASYHMNHLRFNWYCQAIARFFTHALCDQASKRSYIPVPVRHTYLPRLQKRRLPAWNQSNLQTETSTPAHYHHRWCGIRGHITGKVCEVLYGNHQQKRKAHHFLRYIIVYYLALFKPTLLLRTYSLKLSAQFAEKSLALSEKLFSSI